MLDDVKTIHERDVQDALGIAEHSPEQLLYDFSANLDSLEGKSYKNVVLAGMGGSALAGLITSVWPGFNVPFEIVRNYDLPSYVSEDTLVIASSYSGNTEETLSEYAQAKTKNSKIIVITSGGKLAELAASNNDPIFIIPSGMQPRHAVFYSLLAIVTITDKLGITVGKVAELQATKDHLKNAIAGWTLTVPTSQNYAKQLAQESIGKSVVVYGSPLFFPAAYKWKISFNENAKQVAWCNQIPEFNHNEFLGWTKQPVDKPYTVFDIRSDLDLPQVQKRFVVTAKLLSGLRPEPIIISPQGSNLIEQLLWTISLGDFVTIYTALLNGLNPTPVDMIEKFKKELV